MIADLTTLRSVTGQAPREDGYRHVQIAFVPADHESPHFWAVEAFDHWWNNLPAVRWSCHAQSRQEAEQIAAYLRTLRD